MGKEIPCRDKEGVEIEWEGEVGKKRQRGQNVRKVNKEKQQAAVLWKTAVVKGRRKLRREKKG